MKSKKKKQNIVYIVGAGPGNPELLTLKAFRLIREYADVIVYDRLVPEEILALIPKNAEKVYAGKSCRTHYMTQKEINIELVRQAKKGKKVVRLKGGDPFIFGRGGEETEFLAKNNVDFEVVPGITSASGCSSVANIPLTHRGIATSVRFITGHMQKGKPVKLDWKGLIDPETTLVVYMGLANLHNICVSLVKHGMAKSMPVAAIQSGTTENERILFGRIDTIAKKIQQAKLEPPTLIIIGKVVNIGKKLSKQP